MQQKKNEKLKHPSPSPPQKKEKGKKWEGKDEKKKEIGAS